MNIRFPSPELESVPSDARTAAERTGMSGRTWVILGIVAIVTLGFVLRPVVMGLLAEPPKKPLPPVVVQPVRLQDVTVVEHTIGTVVSNATVQVNARVQGQILKANFQEGDTVKTGQLLFQIDPGPYQATYNSAMATL